MKDQPDKFEYHVDGLIIVRNGLDRSARAERIERLTKTQVVLTTGEKFKRHDGWQTGRDSCRSKWIEERTPEKLDLVVKSELVRRLLALSRDELLGLTLERLRSAWRTLDAGPPSFNHGIYGSWRPGRKDKEKPE